MLDKMSDTSRIVERLVKKELVEKKVCDTDKRLVDVIISPTGLDVLKSIREIVLYDIYFITTNLE